MKIVMVIPTYWRTDRVPAKDQEIIFDHPTHISEEGLLPRLLESIEVLNDRDFDIAVVGASEFKSRYPRMEVDGKLRVVLEPYVDMLDTDIHLFSHYHRSMVREYLKEKGFPELIELVTISGYSSMRNMCSLAALILDADVVISIDDDEVFNDPNFISKAVENIGKKYKGKPIMGVCGHYEVIRYRPPEPGEPTWDIFWTSEIMRKAHASAKEPPRLKEAKWALGGNMVFHRDLISTIPFDINIARGEDCDYVINAKMFDYTMVMDAELSIAHIPPPTPFPDWLKLRMDIRRFVYTRKKLLCQEPREGLKYVSIESLDPYPGTFLKEDLQERIFKTNILLGMKYLSEGKIDDCNECMKNIQIAVEESQSNINPFLEYLELQKKWKKLTSLIEEDEKFKEKMKKKMRHLGH